MDVNDFYPKGSNGCIKQTDEIKCPECAEWSKLDDWTETYIGCEDCGDHSGAACPKCGDAIDFVYVDKVENREPSITPSGK